jgi:plasmid stabilization system protein ParE
MSIFDNSAEDDLFDIYTYAAINDSVERADKLFNAVFVRLAIKIKDYTFTWSYSTGIV